MVPSPLLPSSLGPLQPLAPALALLPPASAADIASKDEYVGNKKVRVFARGLLLVGSALWGEIPSRYCIVVGDGISRPLFWHLPQQYHPVHCCPTLRHSHALLDGPVVEQVDFRVQLQHRLTISWARWIEQLTVELLPNSPAGVSPFLFCPRNGPVIVINAGSATCFSSMRLGLTIWVNIRQLYYERHHCVLFFLWCQSKGIPKLERRRKYLHHVFARSFSPLSEK